MHKEMEKLEGQIDLHLKKWTQQSVTRKEKKSFLTSNASAQAKTTLAT